MKVYVYPADVQGCGYVRLIWAANHLRRTGHDVVVIPPNAPDGTGISGAVDTRTDDIATVDVPSDADVIVLQRVLYKHIAQAIPIMRRQGLAVVVDMDDDLTRIDPRNPAFMAMHPVHAKDPKRHWGWASKACDDATLVTCSTPALLDVYARHGRGVVVENAIPAGFLALEHFDSDIIGWGGSMHSHPADMIPVGSSIATLQREGYDFAVVGPRDGVKRALHLDREPDATGPVDIMNWPIALAQGFGIGITPLADTLFNAAKSWLKPLEMMAVGIPWVASPRAEYRRLHAVTGVGLLADKPRDWLRHLRRLAIDDALREDMSAAGRLAAAKLTIEAAYAPAVWAAWTQALDMQRSGDRAQQEIVRAGQGGLVAGAAPVVSPFIRPRR